MGQRRLHFATSTRAYRFHRTGYCIVASWRGVASRCSGVPGLLYRCSGARRSHVGTGSHGDHRRPCTVSRVRHATAEHTPLRSSSCRSWAYASTRDWGESVPTNVSKSTLVSLYLCGTPPRFAVTLRAMLGLACGGHCTFCGRLWWHSGLDSRCDDAGWPNEDRHNDPDTGTQWEHSKTVVYEK